MRTHTFVRPLFTILSYLGIFGMTAPSYAALVGYWTLDDLSSGLQNQGSNLQSDLTALNTPTVTTGIIGSGISLDGSTQYLTNTVAGNAADALIGAPYSMSVWVRTLALNADHGPMTILNISNNVTTSNPSQYTSVAAFFNSGGHDTAYLTSRDGSESRTQPSPGPNPTNAVGPNWINDGFWHHLTGVISGTGASQAQLYIDGKAAASPGTAQAFYDAMDTITIGALSRAAVSDFFLGSVDDAGIFSNALTAADVAIINGLGHTGGLGLDWLDDAQAIAAGPLDGVGLIDGFMFQKVGSQVGTTGAWTGSTAGGDAYILYDGGSGFALVQVPEPSGILLVAIGMISLGAFRRGK